VAKAAAPGPYHDIATEIGAQNTGTRLGNPTHDVGMEMSVAVPHADRDHGQLWRNPRQKQRRRQGFRPVMTNFQDLKVRREIVEGGLLRIDPGVAGQERLKLSIADQKDDGCRVGIRSAIWHQNSAYGTSTPSSVSVSVPVSVPPIFPRKRRKKVLLRSIDEGPLLTILILQSLTKQRPNP
jgi:hypothetical protein